MKSLFEIIFFVLAITAVSFSQYDLQENQPDNLNSTTGSDVPLYSINIRKQVQMQIDSALSRDQRGVILSNFYCWDKTSNTAQARTLILTESPNEDGNTFQIKIIILLSFAGILFFVIVIRRFISNGLKQKESRNRHIGLSQNLISISKDQIELMGNKLRKSAFITNEEEVSDTAKELKLSKGELVLASKLRAYEIFNLGINNKLRDKYD